MALEFYGKVTGAIARHQRWFETTKRVLRDTQSGSYGWARTRDFTIASQPIAHGIALSKPP
jgi:hypothetical protein